ncbi:unnamed protein product [Microthlaspi erraticum]|uniref:Uncharacterized protein n=1 Tax=Microthlaspi erraticum TaxID=1685480 RepID=A0A6D2J661_9BRAS|nr:unnamed protein product [Microthlaspi erraticum]
MDQQGRKQAKRSRRSSIDSTQGRSTCTRDQARSIPSPTGSIDACMERQHDRSHSQKQARSIPCRASSIDPVLSQPSINPAQMISQPFDLLGANRLDRTTANRIEPKSTPELFRPIFSHCLGYAVFQSFTLLFIVSEGEEIKPLLFTVWRRFLNPCFAIFLF